MNIDRRTFPQASAARALVPRRATLLALMLLLACGAPETTEQKGNAVKLDTIAGFKLGMLLPEARSVADVRGEGLRCERPAERLSKREEIADSVLQFFSAIENCYPADGPYRYSLQFRKGTLHQVRLGMSEDWDLIPVDTLVSRFARVYGPPSVTDETDRDEGGKYFNYYWERASSPAVLQIRCPDREHANQCDVEYYLSRRT